MSIVSTLPAQWFLAAYLVTTHTPGLSPLQLQRQLGLRRYATAWAMLQKLRRAMGRHDRDRLRDKVEGDESYVGRPEAGLRGGRELRDKALGVAAVEGRGAASGRVRLQVVPDASGRSGTSRAYAARRLWLGLRHRRAAVRHPLFRAVLGALLPPRGLGERISAARARRAPIGPRAPG